MIGRGPPPSGASEDPPPTDLLDTPAAGPAAARGGALRAASYAAGTLLALVSAPLMIRHLGVDDFGRYITVLSLIAVVAGFTEAGVTTIALREYASLAGEERTRVMRDLLGIRVTLTVAGVAVAVVFALLAGYPAVLVWGTAFVGVGLLLQSTQQLLGVALHGELRFGWVSGIDLARQVMWVALIVALVVARAGLEPFFLAQIPPFALALVITAVLVRNVMPLVPALRPAGWWPLLRDSFAYAVAVALNAAYFRVAVIALSLMASERETGWFATAFRVIEVLIGVPALVIGAAFPILARAARDDRERLDSAATRLLEIALILGVWIALGVALAAEPIITVLAGDESRPSVGLLRIQGFALVATFVTVTAGYVLLSLRRHREILAANAAALAMALVLTGLLVPPYEATGAAVAVLSAEVVLAGTLVVFLARARPATLASVRRAPAVLAAGGAAALVALVPGVPPVADAVVALTVYPLLLRLVRRFPPEIGEALRNRRTTLGSPTA